MNLMSLNLESFCASFGYFTRIRQSFDPTGLVVDAIDDDADAAKGCRAAASTTDNQWYILGFTTTRPTNRKSKLLPIKDPKLVRQHVIV